MDLEAPFSWWNSKEWSFIWQAELKQCFFLLWQKLPPDPGRVAALGIHIHPGFG